MVNVSTRTRPRRVQPERTQYDDKFVDIAASLPPNSRWQTTVTSTSPSNILSLFVQPLEKTCRAQCVPWILLRLVDRQLAGS